MRALAIALTLCALLVACDDTAIAPSNGAVPGSGGGQMSFSVSSGAFDEGAPIPSEYTCDGADHQLPVSWSGAPANTAEFALLMDDPDANGFVHWVVVGIPTDATALADPLPPGAVAGQSDFGRSGYRGPCPPSGTHTYTITVYALSAPLGLTGSATGTQVRAAVADKTLATGTLTGTYTRGRSS